MIKMRDCTAAESMALGMGTVITNEAYGVRAKEALQAAEKETLRLEKLLSRFIPGSDIGRINSMAGRRLVKVSSETFEVLSRAYEYSACCQGAFDVTAGPLAALWSVLKRTSEPPIVSEIKKLLPLVDYTGLILNEGTKTAGLKKAGQSVDLGGIAKGYAADKITDVFRRYGIVSAYTNFGGNVAAVGAKPDGEPWRVGIRHPRREDGLIGAVSVIDKSVVTSGDYQRCFIAGDGRRYHHILDTSTGYPAEKGLISVTVVADSSMAADALSTVVFTTGLVKGIEILKAFPGTEAVLIDTKLSVYVTSGLTGCFQTAEDIGISIIK